MTCPKHIAAMLSILFLLGPGCESEPRSSESGTDVGIDATVEPDIGPKDTTTPSDGAADSDDGCYDLRHPNDYKQADGWCWAPPEDYCAQGGSTIVTRGCKPDFSLCCTFATSCITCGWIDCFDTTDPRCDTAPLDTNDCQDPMIQPDFEATFCFD